MKGKERKRIEETGRLLNIAKRLKNEDMLFLYNNLSSHSRNLMSELVFNVLYNTNALKLPPKSMKRIRKVLSPYRKEFEVIALKETPEPKKNKIMRKQIGRGIITTLVATLAPAIVSLIANSVKK